MRYNPKRNSRSYWLEQDSNDGLEFLLNAVGKIAKMEAYISMGAMKSHISKNESYKRYDRKRVEFWINEGVVNPVKVRGNTSTVYLSVIELEAASQTSNHAELINRRKLLTKKIKQ